MNLKVQVLGKNLDKVETFILWQDTAHGRAVSRQFLQSVRSNANIHITLTTEKRTGTWREPLATAKHTIKIAA